MISVGIDPKQIEALRQSLKGKANRLPREIATAINKTAKDVRIVVAREMRKELPSKIKMSTLKKVIRSKSKATSDHLRATIQLNKGHPFPLRYFSPTAVKGKKGTKKRAGTSGGVNVRLGRVKGKAGKTFLPNAFIVKQWGSNVFERINKGPGSGRGPLKQLFGPSPGDIWNQTGIVSLAWKTARQQLPLQIERRIRFLSLQSSGGLRGNSAGRKGRGNQ